MNNLLSPEKAEISFSRFHHRAFQLNSMALSNDIALLLDSMGISDREHVIDNQRFTQWRLPDSQKLFRLSGINVAKDGLFKIEFAEYDHSEEVIEYKLVNLSYEIRIKFLEAIESVM